MKTFKQTMLGTLPQHKSPKDKMIHDVFSAAREGSDAQEVHDVFDTQKGWVAISAKAVQALTEEEWLSERLNIAVRMLDHCVEIDSCKRGGIPVLRGTRFTVAQLLAEIADGRDVGGLCTSFALGQ